MAAGLRLGAGLAREWPGGLVLSFNMLWAQLAAGRISRTASGPRLFPEAWLAKLEGKDREANPGRDKTAARPCRVGVHRPGARPPNTGIPARLPGAAATLGKGR